MKIRQGNNSDLNAIIEIALAAWEPVYKGYKEQMGEEIFEKFHHNWEKIKSLEICNSIKSGRWRLFVTEKEGEIVAFITIMILEDESIGIIGNNAVNPKFQGLGIGAMQYKYVLDVMKKEGALYAKVVTGGDNAHIPARRAYEKAGFLVKIPSVMYYMKLD